MCQSIDCTMFNILATDFERLWQGQDARDDRYLCHT